jgi:hypothetical protein
MKKKLVLHRETLRQLSTPMFGRVVHGGYSAGAETCAVSLASLCSVFMCGGSDDCPGPKTDEITICICEI